MSTEITWTLQCDSPGCTATVEARGHSDYATKARLRHVARDLGWSVTELGDYCAVHRKKAEAA